ncbi:MAG: DUF4129 domain-containing protein, partial [Caldimonas sp.]
PWSRQMAQMRRVLESVGVAAHVHDAPRSLAERVRTRLGPPAEALAVLLAALDRQRYGRDAITRPDKAWTRRFAAEAQRLRSSGRR